ncbi:MAG: 23S rRNA (uracil(1939)-C(5))-methyltransferase RlmD [Clostridiales bacterium]|nr:23S rRNA (uracil(1939)-C(5))-methyltransferase RlmD [Clostridiales bacterium]
MKKNDEFIIKIEDMSVDGLGIGRYEGMTFFVKDALIGDIARVGVTKLKKTYGYARVIELIRPSPDRGEPPCPIHRRCGGCQIQALSYSKQLEFKQKKVENDLRRIGGFEEIPIEPIVGMKDPFHYRNKAQFPVGTDKDGHIIAGFYAGRTHSIIPTGDCVVGVPVNREILDVVISFMEEHHISTYNEETGEGLVRHVLIRYGFSTKEILVCLVINGQGFPGEDELAERLWKIPGMTSFSVNINQRQDNVILGDETRFIRGKEYITDYIGEVKFQISPESFYQVNPVQTKVMYDLALDYAGLSGSETVWDLYCGIGTISLFMAKKAGWVYGVETVPQAVADAGRNAKINGIKNVEFIRGKAEEVLPEFCGQQPGGDGSGKRGSGSEAHVQKVLDRNSRMARPDVVVVDPPRKGCDERLLETIIEAAPDRIVYVSCNPSTLARDLRILCDGGYELKKVSPVDNFPQTVHVETVVLMSRVSNEP